MNKYEAVIMFYPEVEEEKRNASFDRLKKVIEKDGKINNVDEWGMKKLAYTSTRETKLRAGKSPSNRPGVKDVAYRAG